jgi:DNA-binding MarR family transcriptional regulator
MSLKDEIGKRGPFQSLEQEAVLNVLKTTEQLHAQATELLKPYGISPTQYNVLRILRGASATCSNSGIACKDIADRMITRDPDMTRLLDRLEKRQLIARTRCPEDRRVVKTSITADAIKMLSELEQPMIDLHQKQVGHLGEERLKQLVSLMEGIREKQPAASSAML